jgi:WD40 repeat protein
MNMRTSLIVALLILGITIAGCGLPLGLLPLPPSTTGPIPTPNACQKLSESNLQQMTRLSQLRSSTPVADLEFISNNRLLTVAYASSDDASGWIRTWDVEKAEVAKEMEIEQVHAYLSRISGIGSVMVTVEDRAEIVRQRGQEFPTSLENHIIEIVDVWDINTGERVATFPKMAAVKDLDVSPDGRFVVTGDERGTLALKRVAGEAALDGESVLLQTERGVQVPVVVKFDRGGEAYAYGLDNGEIGIRRLGEGLETEHAQGIHAPADLPAGAVLSLAFDSNRQALAVLRSNAVEVHDIQSFWPPDPLVEQLPDTLTGTLVFTPQGDLIVITTPSGWQLRRRADLTLLAEDTEQAMTAAAISKDGCFIAFGSESGTVEVWGVP